MEVLEVIKSRRSIRRYKTDPVDDKTVELVLEAARLAPSWANTQCWRFIVVRDSNIKVELVSTLGGTNPDLSQEKSFLSSFSMINTAVNFSGGLICGMGRRSFAEKCPKDFSSNLNLNEL